MLHEVNFHATAPYFYVLFFCRTPYISVQLFQTLVLFKNFLFFLSVLLFVLLYTLYIGGRKRNFTGTFIFFAHFFPRILFDKGIPAGYNQTMDIQRKGAAGKEGRLMPTSEKEINCYLLDQLELIERLEAVAEESNASEVLKQLAIEKKFVERKLYQNPPIQN